MVSDGDAVQVKEQVLLAVLWRIPAPQNRPFSHFRILYPIRKKICQPIGNNKTGFPPRKIGYFGFKARIVGIRKNVFKSAPIRPVTKNRPKSEYARIEPL